MEVDRDNSTLAQEKRAIVSRSRRKATHFISADWQDGHRDISFSLKRRWQVMFWFSVWTIVCRTCQFTRVKYCHRNDFQKSHENHHIWRMQQMAMWFRFAKRMISVHEKLFFQIGSVRGFCFTCRICRDGHASINKANVTSMSGTFSNCMFDLFDSRVHSSVCLA